MTFILYMLIVLSCFSMSALLLCLAIREWKSDNGDLLPIFLCFMACVLASTGFSYFKESLQYSKEQDRIKVDKLQQDAERAEVLMHTA